MHPASIFAEHSSTSYPCFCTGQMILMAEWLHSMGCGQWLDVQVETCDKWCSSQAGIGTALFNILFKDMQSGNICTSQQVCWEHKFVWWGSHTGGKKDFDGLEVWAHMNLMKFKDAKCKILHVCQGNLKQKYRLEREWTKNSTEERDLGLLVGKKLDTIQQCELSAKRANHILECTKRSMACRLRKVILPHYYILRRPHLGDCSWLFGLLRKKDKDLLEWVRTKAIKMIRTGHISYERARVVHLGEKNCGEDL